MSIELRTLAESKPRDTSRPSDTSNTTLAFLPFESNFLRASRTSTYGLYGDTELLETRMRNDLAAFPKSLVNGWRTCKLPLLMYPTITSDPSGSDLMNSRVISNSLLT